MPSSISHASRRDRGAVSGQSSIRPPNGGDDLSAYLGSFTRLCAGWHSFTDAERAALRAAFAHQFLPALPDEFYAEAERFLEDRGA